MDTSFTRTFLANSELGQRWRTLRVFNTYRLFIIGIFIAIYNFEIIPLTQDAQQYSYLMLTAGYLCFGIISTACAYFRLPKFMTQIHMQVILDIIILTLLIHTGIGKFGSLSVLINIAIAGGSILTTQRIALKYAFIATILLVMSNFARHDSIQAIDQIQLLLLTTNYFLTAILMSKLSNRLITSEALAVKRGDDLAKLEQLNSYIIQRFRSGIIVIDEAMQIQLINNAAKQLLNLNNVVDFKTFESKATELTKRFYQWSKQNTISTESFQESPKGPTLFVEFTLLKGKDKNLSLIFIEDSTRTAQQAQQLKLASLGRLTASIAHELRNPLGAISHAVQLLEESQDTKAEEQRLIEIIGNHSERMNIVIKNILQLSRGEKVHASEIELKPWIAKFINEFTMVDVEEWSIDFQVEPATMKISVDTSQLQQILTNLCENGLRYSLLQHKKATLNLIAGINQENKIPYLDIIDQGEGVPEEFISKIFEPFFTTKRSGTGLGLYIAKELCEANQAKLEYIKHQNTGGWFRITFYGNQL